MLNFDIVPGKVGQVIGDQIVHPSGTVLSIDPGDGCHRDLRGQGHAALKMLLQAVRLDQLSAVGVSHELVDLRHARHRTEAACILVGQQSDHQAQRRAAIVEVLGHIHAVFLPVTGGIQGMH